jgi:hypothetical protein
MMRRFSLISHAHPGLGKPRNHHEQQAAKKNRTVNGAM